MSPTPRWSRDEGQQVALSLLREALLEQQRILWIVPGQRFMAIAEPKRRGRADDEDRSACPLPDREVAEPPARPAPRCTAYPGPQSKAVESQPTRLQLLHLLHPRDDGSKLPPPLDCEPGPPPVHLHKPPFMEMLQLLADGDLP